MLGDKLKLKLGVMKDRLSGKFSGFVICFGFLSCVFWLICFANSICCLDKL